MAVSNDAVYAQKPVNFAAKATAAKTTMSDSTNAVLLHTASANGDVVTRVKARPQGTATAGVCYLFTSKDSGTTLSMKEAEAAAADTVSTTDAPAPISFSNISEDAPMLLSPNEQLYCAISVALSAGYVFEGHAEQLTPQ